MNAAEKRQIGGSGMKWPNQGVGGRIVSRPAEERFWEKVDKSSPCWIWRGARSRAGYGVFWFNGRNEHSHRVAYLLTTGPIGGLDVCHRCDNPPCCNPAHLFLGTASDNAKDMVSKGRQYSARGEDHASSRLTDAAVLRIRELHGQGVSNFAMARMYGVRSETVRAVVVRKTWRHLP